MNHPRAVGIGRKRDLFRAVCVNGVEPLAAALEKDADEIDQRVCVAGRRFYRWRMPQIGLHRMDLPDTTKWLEEVCKLGPAHCHPDAIVPLGQGSHHMPAEKP